MRLITIPGVGPITGLAFRVTVDNPARFGPSKTTGAHVGLTPRVYQSGETDRSGQVSMRGTVCFAICFMRWPQRDDRKLACHRHADTLSAAAACNHAPQGARRRSCS
jgi:transposase